ncbi:hypothetical protein T07_9280 [Trichinella nelsoni]|uniref:Secreted protein n=1 Tax=Trichinella nelsoni TaxID=6336 RepID=A0A0V0RLY2_9BILA|nr:hypothetical protein T07_9280 [Trichinella nelsoni]
MIIYCDSIVFFFFILCLVAQRGKHTSVSSGTRVTSERNRLLQNSALTFIITFMQQHATPHPGKYKMTFDFKYLIIS